jgi:hypothetical protein
MANITDLETIRFVKEEIRPLCEKVRALKAEITATKNKYNGQINLAGSQFQLAANADVVTENRTAESITNLTKLQITQAFAQLDIVTTLNDQIVQVPCVRPLEAN